MSKAFRFYTVARSGLARPCRRPACIQFVMGFLPRLHTGASRIVSLVGLATLLCASTAVPAQAETRRLCDRSVTYDIVPPVGLPASLSILSGVWRGTIILAGGSEMCVSMVVKEIHPDGRINLLITWNVSMGGRDDINNFVGMGEALDWPNKVENGEIRIDGGDLFKGTHYYYVMKVPTEANPDVMEGKWMTDTHPQPIVLYREKKR